MTGAARQTRSSYGRSNRGTSFEHHWTGGQRPAGAIARRRRANGRIDAALMSNASPIRATPRQGVLNTATSLARVGGTAPTPRLRRTRIRSPRAISLQALQAFHPRAQPVSTPPEFCASTQYLVQRPQTKFKQGVLSQWMGRFTRSSPRKTSP